MNSRNSELQQLITIMDNLPEGIILLNANRPEDFIILDCNILAKRVLNISPEKDPSNPKNRNFFEYLFKVKFLSLRSKDIILENLRECKSFNKTLKFFISVKIPNEREKKILEITHIPIQGNTDEDFKILIKFQESSEALPAEIIEEANKQRIQLKDIQQHAKIGSFEWKILNNKVQWSEGFAALMDIDMPSNETGITDFFYLFDRETQKEINEYFRQLFMGNKKTQDGITFKCKNNGSKYYLLKAFPKNFSGEGKSMISGFLQDISEIEFTKKSLLKKEILLKEVGEHAPVCSFEYIPEKECFIWTQEVYGIYRIKKGQKIMLKEYLKLLSPSEKEKFLANMEELEKEEKKKVKYLQKYVDPKGRIKYLQIKCESKKDKKNRIKVFGIIKDISNYKKAELEIVKRNKELERISSILKEQNETLFQMAFLISHSLRKPVANIMAILHLIKLEKKEDMGYKDYLPILDLSAEELDEVLHEINKSLSLFLRKFSAEESIEQGKYPEIKFLKSK